MARGSCGRSDLVIVAEHHPQRSVLRLRGELDACGEARLRWAICAVVSDHPRPILEMDLSALTFADCAGLSVMVWAHKHLAEQGHELVITGARPVIRRLLRLTGLDEYLHFCRSEPDGSPDEFPRIQHLAPACRGHPVVRDVAGSARKPPRSTLSRSGQGGDFMTRDLLARNEAPPQTGWHTLGESHGHPMTLPAKGECDE